MLKRQAADLVECFIREFVPPPADPSWDVGGRGECFICDFVLPPPDPSCDVGGRGSVLFVTLFSHRLTPRGT